MGRTFFDKIECYVSDTLEKELNCREIINCRLLQHLPYNFNLIFEELSVVRCQTFCKVEHHFCQEFLQCLLCDGSFIGNFQYRHCDFPNRLSSEERFKVAIVCEITMFHH